MSVFRAWFEKTKKHVESVEAAGNAAAQTDRVRRFLLLLEMIVYKQSLKPPPKPWVTPTLITECEVIYFEDLAFLKACQTSAEGLQRLQREFYGPIEALGIPLSYRIARVESFSKMMTRGTRTYQSTLLMKPHMPGIRGLAERLLIDRDVVFEALIGASPERERETLWHLLGCNNKRIRCRFSDWLRSSNDYRPSEDGLKAVVMGFQDWMRRTRRDPALEEAYKKRLQKRLEQESVRNPQQKDSRSCVICCAPRCVVPAPDAHRRDESPPGQNPKPFGKIHGVSAKPGWWCFGMSISYNILEGRPLWASDSHYFTNND
jgi:hypothetical protein